MPPAGKPAAIAAAAIVALSAGAAALLHAFPFLDAGGRKQPVLAAARLWLGGTLVFAMGGIGHAILSTLPAADGRRARSTQCVAVGAVAAALLVFGLAAMQMLNAAGLAVLAAVLAFGVYAAVRYATERVKDLENRETPLLPMFLLLVAGHFALLALAPPTGWDAMTYHLQLPRLYIEHGGFFAASPSLFANMPMNVQMLHLAAMWIGDPIVAQLLQPIFFLLLARELAHLAGDAEAGAIAAILLAMNGVVAWQLPLAYIDVTLAFFLAVMAGSVMDAVGGRQSAVGGAEDPSPPTADLRPPTVFFLLCGFLGGAKYTMAGPVLAVAVAAAICFFGDLRRVLSFKLLAAGFAIALVPLVPWLAKGWFATGNPVYPLLTSIFGEADTTADSRARLFSWMQAFGRGQSPADLLALPWRVAMESGETMRGFHGRVSPVFAVVATVGMLVGLRDRRSRFLTLAFAIGFVLWGFGSQQARFLVPLLPLAVVPASMAAARAIRAIRERIPGDIHTVIFFDMAISWVLVAAVLVPAMVAHQKTGGVYPFDFLTGRTIARDYIAARVDSFRAQQRLAEFTRLGEPVRFYLENRALYSPVPVVADSSHEAAPWLDDAALAGSAQAFAKLRRDRGEPMLLLVHETNWRLYFVRLADMNAEDLFDDPIHEKRMDAGLTAFKAFLDIECDLIAREGAAAIYRQRPAQ